VVVDLDFVTLRLADAGFVAAREEAEELLEYSQGNDDRLESMINRRLRGEPLAWITGYTMFCGLKIRVDSGVYVPRWQSEPLVFAAAERLPPTGTAIDLCTGSGAIAMTLHAKRPDARVIGTDLDERSVTCATSNGVEVYLGDLFAPLPRDLEGNIDVIVGVVPYVPSRNMGMLQRDTFTFESPKSYDGGDDGTEILRRVIAESPQFLRPGGALLLELGGEQSDALANDLERHGFKDVVIHFDEDGDERGVEATLIQP
jgi:release factor glutamine methyltransferase